jgi:hypothetical protein
MNSQSPRDVNLDPEPSKTPPKRILFWVLVASVSALGMLTVICIGLFLALGAIFGGINSAPDSLNSGALYDPANNSWTEMPTENAPSGRYNPYTFWTGEEMLVWGGFIERADFPVNDTIAIGGGGLYNPATNTWRKMTSKEDPGGRGQPIVIWTGTDLIVWGGIGKGGRGEHPRSDGAIYHLATNTWSQMTTEGAPSARFNSVGVWTGNELIIWGGSTAPGLHPRYGDYESDGALYNPRTDSWTQMPTASAPEGSRDPIVAWTGSELVIWNDDTGARFNLTAHSWSEMPHLLPGMRQVDLAQWTGEEVLIWGNPVVRSGLVSGSPLQSWKPGSEIWQSAPDSGYFTDAAERDAAWGGRTLLVVGPGRPSEVDGRVIATFDPRSQRWRRLSGVGLPDGVRGRITWTEETALMTVGERGWQYRSESDRWSELPADGRPSPRTGSTAMWTGEVFVVWGGLVQD